MEKVKADGPGQTLIALVKATANEIADHGQEFIEGLPLSGHLRLVTRGHQHVLILLDLKHELVLHAGSLLHRTRSGTLDPQKLVWLALLD